MTRGAARVEHPGDADWVTQDQAALLTGAPLSSIDWWSRSGKIRTRPKSEGPTIHRQSLVRHADGRRRVAAARLEAQADRASRQRVTPGSITTAEAASILNVSREHVLTVARSAGLTIEGTGRRLRLRRSEVEVLAEERARWISVQTAAAITGLPARAIANAIRGGLIERRPDARQRQASASRESVLAWAEQERARRQEKAAKRQAEAPGPPRDGHSWMSVRSASVLLGLSRARVGQLIAAERLPATRRGRRWWLRYDHVLSAMAGREHVTGSMRSDLSVVDL